MNDDVFTQGCISTDVSSGGLPLRMCGFCVLWMGNTAGDKTAAVEPVAFADLCPPSLDPSSSSPAECVRLPVLPSSVSPFHSAVVSPAGMTAGC